VLVACLVRAGGRRARLRAVPVAKISFSYLTSNSQPFVPLLFNSRLPVLHINERGQAAPCRPAL
jgi:hypothetical protein